MPRFQLIKEGIPSLLPMTNRTRGIHISTIINDICIERGYYKAGLLPNMTKLQLGCALETALATRYCDDDRDRNSNIGQLFQPGELCHDGYYGTPDFCSWDSERNTIILHEVKLSWLSSNHEVDSEKMWKYWAQIKAYCYMIKTYYSCLHICHVRGDYKGINDPVCHVWEGIFTKQELVDNWRLLTEHALTMQARGFDFYKAETRVLEVAA